MQAHNKAAMEIRLSGMGKPRRKKVPNTLLRGVIAANVLARAAIQFEDSDNVPMAIRNASHPAERERLHKSNIQLIMAGKTSPTIEQLHKLAVALDLLPYQLLIPNLDASNPQVAQGPAVREELAYGPELKQAVKEAVEDALATTSGTRARKPVKAR